MSRDRSSSDEGASVLALWQGRSQGSVPWRKRCSLSSGESRVRRGVFPVVLTPSERTLSAPRKAGCAMPSRAQIRTGYPPPSTGRHSRHGRSAETSYCPTRSRRSSRRVRETPRTGSGNRYLPKPTRKFLPLFPLFFAANLRHTAWYAVFHWISCTYPPIKWGVCG